jgi:hypothetical protein
MIFNKKELILIGSLTTLLIASFLVLSLVDNGSMTGYTAYTYQEVVDQRVGEYEDGSGFVGFVDGFWYNQTSNTLCANGWIRDYDALDTPVEVALYWNDTLVDSGLANRPQWEEEFGTWENELLYNLEMRYLLCGTVPASFKQNYSNLTDAWDDIYAEAADPVTGETYLIEIHGEAYNLKLFE